MTSKGEQGTDRLDQSKKRYNPPKIDCIGPISKFTQTGTGLTTEMADGGSGMCSMEVAMNCI